MESLAFAPIPTVSIILPTYNRAAYLTDCIQSVLAQDFTDWELLIIDDGSEDESFAIANTFLQKNARIRYQKHQNRKTGFSRNAGIQSAWGQYITFIDSDDRYLPHHLSSRLSYLNAHPEVDLISGGFRVEGDEWVADYYQPGQKINLYDCVTGATFFGKRQVFMALGGFQNLNYGEDTDLWERAAQQFQVAKITQPQTYRYIRTANSITNAALREM
ncbi:glycosyltransferase family A protein [Spirulina sp. CCNP1310]|uniref:glycosyltransferase family 2 protein n=1 Tax=Spirulina sp. CCNP1310 TaxID=3110249 RepID=UPI002B1F3F96|nr:glycosyltransferase family A protein [Spirulina sp. CCNP1310]MEA5420763.1 glycosyltransferase family A protein [Spirulina sp. CCNP1310]